MIKTPKNWIGDEGRRNREHAALYAGIITRAYGVTFELFVGHHVAFKSTHESLTTENEIPSADTLLFDHDIMKEVFGDKYLGVLIPAGAGAVQSARGVDAAAADGAGAGRAGAVPVRDPGPRGRAACLVGGV